MEFSQGHFNVSRHLCTSPIKVWCHDSNWSYGGDECVVCRRVIGLKCGFTQIIVFKSMGGLGYYNSIHPFMFLKVPGEPYCTNYVWHLVWCPVSQSNCFYLCCCLNWYISINPQPMTVVSWKWTYATQALVSGSIDLLNPWQWFSLPPQGYWDQKKTY